MSAADWKAKGNAALQAGNFDEAISMYTKAIELDPSNHVFFSNRSAAYLSKGDAEKALQDADKCITLNSTWAKGYVRKGAALHKLRRYTDAVKAYNEGLTTSPGDAGLTRGLEDVSKAQEAARAAAGGSNPLESAFGPNVLEKLATNPKFVSYLADPGFVAKIKMLQSNPTNMQAALSDPRIMEAFGFLLGIDTNAMGGMGRHNDPPAPPTAAPASASGLDGGGREAEEQGEEEDEEMADLEEDDEAAAAQKQLKADKAAALECKKRGNTHYSKKEFVEALAAYNEAIKLDPTNMAYISNKAAVHFEQKEYDMCIEQCKEAIEVGRAARAPYADVGKAFVRMGKAAAKKGDKVQAIKYLQDAQMEHHTKESERLIKTYELEARKEAAAAYINPELALEAKGRGNDHFRAGSWAEAIKDYEEAVKRDPSNAAYRNNLAAALTKIGDFNSAKTACEKALEIDPKYVKAWAKKGDIEFFMKEYHKALDSYNKGLAVEGDNALCKEGLRKTTLKINESAGTQDKERAAHAYADPEVQAILMDPMVRQVLNDFKDNPTHAQKALQDDGMRAKIEKLVAAGIIQTG